MNKSVISTTLVRWTIAETIAAVALALATPLMYSQAAPSASSPSVPSPASSSPSATPTPAKTPSTATPTATPQQPGASGAQTPTLQPRDENAPPTPGSQASSITVYSNEVDLIFTVAGKNGRFVTGLQQQAFGLLDDGKPPLRVRSFTQQTNLPLRVGIMLDTSNSIRRRFQFEQQAATDFLLQVLHPADRAFVEGFDQQTDVSQDFTNRIDLLDTGIRKLRPGGGTALFDSLYTTCRDQMLTLKEKTPVRKALVLVSDGDDDYSRALESDAIKMCQRAETIVYTISTNVGPSADKGDAILKQIADATGGQSFFPKRIDDVAIGFQNIEEELRSQYLLVYVPADFKQDGSFRTIYLHALDPRYAVRAKKGYFSPRPQR